MTMIDSYYLAVVLSAYMGWSARAAKEKYRWVKRCGGCELRSDRLVQLNSGPVWKTMLRKGIRKMKNAWNVLLQEDGQDIAEYAVMLAVILVLVVATIRLIGTSANTTFSAVSSAIG